jgi:hypothetical protein
MAGCRLCRRRRTLTLSQAGYMMAAAAAYRLLCDPLWGGCGWWVDGVWRTGPSGVPHLESAPVDVPAASIGPVTGPAPPERGI